MKNRIISSIALAILCACFLGLKPQERAYKIDLRLFEILPITSVTGAGPDGKGNISGSTVGVDLTDSLPDHPVLIKTDLKPGANVDELKNEWLSRGYFKTDRSASVLPSGPDWVTAGEYSFSFPEGTLGQDSIRKEFHEDQIQPFWLKSKRQSEYWLTVLPKSSDSHSVILRISFTGKVNTTGTRLGYESLLLDQDVEVPIGKIALVGFPQFRGRKSVARGSVYILSIVTQKQEP